MRTGAIRLAAAALAAALTLAGCVSDTGDSAGKVTISFGHWGNNEENATLAAMVDRFEKLNPDVDVESNWVQGDYEQKLMTTIAGDNTPTVVQISNTQIASYSGAFRPVAVDTSAYYSTNIADAMEVDGARYGVPFVLKTKVMAVNKKLFDKAGLPLPDPEEPMAPERYARTATALTHGSGRSAVYGSAPLWFQGWLTAMGGSFYSADGSRCTVGDDTAADTADFIIRAQSPGGFTPSYLAVQGQDMFDWLSTGRLAMQPDFAPWNVAQLTALPNASDYALVPDPGKGEPMEIDGLAIAKSASSAQRKAADRFTRFMATDTRAQETLTTSKSSLGLPVTEDALGAFRAAAPRLDLDTFVNAVHQSTVAVSPPGDAQIQSTFNNDLFSHTAIGSGHEAPAQVLPRLNRTCQDILDSTRGVGR